MSSKLATVVLILTSYLGPLKGQGYGQLGQISEKCFECLCEAASECDEAAECFNKGPGQYLCGPYHISYEYWKDSGKPGENPDDPLDFERCLNRRTCAEAAIKGYMQKWGNDCDGDMDIDCFDWARIHKAGPRSCNDTWILNTDFWARFNHCYSTIQPLI